MKQLDFKIIKHELAYNGFFKLERYQLQHQLFAGPWSKTITREVFERGHAVAVLPYDPISDQIVLIEQFRIGAIHNADSAWLTEIVAGIIEPGESAEDVARREAIEETGCPLLDMERICHYFVSPGGTTETITLFCGRVDATSASGIHGCSDEDEDIRVFTCSYNEALAMISDGRINSASPIMALQWLALNRDRLRSKWL